MDEEPTLPNLRAHRAGGAPVWPRPQPRPPHTERLPTWGVVLLFVVVALVSFGMVRGVAMVLAQQHNAITAPSQPSTPSHGSGGSGVPSLPTATPAAAPTETAQPTDTPQPTGTAQPTPTSSGGGD